MMNWSLLSQLEWTHPLWGLLALQPLLMGLLLKLRCQQILHYADAHLLPWVLRGSVQGKQDNWKVLLTYVAWLFLACAAAGPRLPLVGDHEQQAIQRHEMDIMVLLDVSPSMRAQDVSPQRLQRAKLELLDLLPRLHGERLGLIAFSGSAGLVMPLNRDYSAMRYYLQLAEPALFDNPGTAIASALDLAMRNMPHEKSPQRAILLLTDAEASALSGPGGTAIWEAAEKLKQAGVKLFILGVGTAAGATIPLDNGNKLVDEGVDIVSRMDQTGFAALAKISGGKLAVVEDAEGDWRALYDNGLLLLPGGRQPAASVQAWQELYARFLIPALLLFSLIHFPLNWKKWQTKIVTLPLLLLLAVVSGVNDAQAADMEAYAAYRAHDHTLAQNLYARLHGYTARMGEGAAAYKRKDYQYAIRQFSAALLESRDTKQREQALYNLGNSYFMAGGFRAAADAFLGVLKYAPDNQDARANLALSAGKLAEMGKSGKKSQGIEGRRGRETGGTLGEDASNKPLLMEDDDKNKIKSSGPRKDFAQAGNARLGAGEKILPGDSAAISADSELAYNAALKKLELATDNPTALHKALVKIEAAKEYVPQLEMSPW